MLLSKKILFACLLVAGISLVLPASGIAQVTTPRPSPGMQWHQTIGLTVISMDYSRPLVNRNGNDRSGKVWGQLVPYGFQKINFGSQQEVPWRAGANENTIITFSDDVKIEGKPLKAGAYGLFMAIHENGKATVIFSENTTSWGSAWYHPDEDALRVDVQTEEIPFTNILTYDIVELGNDYGVVALSWDKKRIPFRVEVDIKDLVAQKMRDELRGAAGFSWQGPQSAAAYCAQQNFNHDEALKWIDQAIAQQKNFNTLSVKATLLQQTGKLEEAVAVTDEAVELANVNQLNALGYQMLQLKKTDKAIEYFKLNVEKNPKVANVYDSLGEGYMAAGEKEKAIASFKKSLSLEPPAFVKQNSIANLKKLGVDVESEGLNK